MYFHKCTSGHIIIYIETASWFILGDGHLRWRTSSTSAHPSGECSFSVRLVGRVHVFRYNYFFGGDPNETHVYIKGWIIGRPLHVPFTSFVFALSAFSWTLQKSSICKADNTVRETKNQYVMSWLNALVTQGRFRSTALAFLRKSHTHCRIGATSGTR